PVLDRGVKEHVDVAAAAMRRKLESIGAFMHRTRLNAVGFGKGHDAGEIQITQKLPVQFNADTMGDGGYSVYRDGDRGFVALGVDIFDVYRRRQGSVVRHDRTEPVVEVAIDDLGRNIRYARLVSHQVAKTLADDKRADRNASDLGNAQAR